MLIAVSHVHLYFVKRIISESIAMFLTLFCTLTPKSSIQFSADPVA